MAAHKNITTIALIIIWFVTLMILFSFIGTLLTVPSTIANIIGVIAVIIVIAGCVWFFKLLSKINKQED